MADALSQQPQLHLWVRTTDGDLSQPVELINADRLLDGAIQRLSLILDSEDLNDTIEHPESGRQIGERDDYTRLLSWTASSIRMIAVPRVRTEHTVAGGISSHYECTKDHRHCKRQRGCRKTTVSSNLAVALAQAGNRVMLFDGDLASQTCNWLWGFALNSTLDM